MSYTPNYPAERTGFVTIATLTSAQTFNSAIISLSGVSQVQTEILASHDGTINIYFYSDSGGTDTIRTLSIPYVASNGYQYFGAPAFGNYVKYSYTNGATGQTDFYYTTKLLTTSLSPQIVRTDGALVAGMTAQLSRSVVVGRDKAGNFKNVGVDADTNLKINISEPLTAFGELRIAELTPLIQITHPYEINLDLIKNTIAGSGTITYNGTNRMINVNSGAAASSSGVMESRRLVKYRSGQGLLIRYTCIYSTGVTGNTQYSGWGDSLDGFFFGYNGTSFGVLQRNSSSGNSFIAQSSWNIDTMLGGGGLSNPSGQTLDTTKGNVFQIQAQWLGFGAITFYIEDQESGRFVPVHRIKYANSSVVPSVINSTFPVRFESTNTTNTTSITMKNASMASFNEGMIRYTGPTKSYNVGPKTTGTNTVMFTLQNPTTYQGKTNRSRIRLTTIHMYTDQSNADPVRFTLQINTTLTGSSFTSIGSYTAINVDSAGTFNAVGQILYQSGVSEVDSATYGLSELDIFLNPGDTLSVVANGANTGSGVSLSWVEDI